MSSSTNSTHLYSTYCASFSRGRERVINVREICERHPVMLDLAQAKVKDVHGRVVIKFHYLLPPVIRKNSD
jgi:hypothetical protein